MKAPEAKSRLFGVLIGINQYSYKQGFQPLCCSTHDAYGLRELLVRETGANYQDVIVLPSHRYPATVQGIRKALLYHLDRATPRDKVIVTFVGYGATIRQKTSTHHVLVTPELNRREL